MGVKHSKNTKRYRISGNLVPVRRNYEDSFPIDADDPINYPTYNLQGVSDTYINEQPNDVDEDPVYDAHTDVWVPREDSEITCTTVDDDAFQYGSRELPYRETVLDGMEQEFSPDHYDVINDSDLYQSDTERKQMVSIRTNRDPLGPSHKLPKIRPDYEQMVKIFQPLIVTNVNVKRLLPHMSFLSDPGRIRAVEERDPRAAVVYLIDELCSNNHTEPGRWKQFIQALEICGYKYIVDTLRGQDPVDHTYQRQYLKIITPVLRGLIDPQELITILWAVDVISTEDKEEIGHIQQNWGALAATDKLLDMVPRRHHFWYAHLVDALKTVGRPEAADILEIPEILNYEEDKGEFSNKYEEPNTKSVQKASSTTDGLPSQTSTMEESRERNTSIIPNNCEVWDCCDIYLEPDLEDDELDKFYLHMHEPNNNSESKPNSHSVKLLSPSMLSPANDWKMDSMFSFGKSANYCYHNVDYTDLLNEEPKKYKWLPNHPLPMATEISDQHNAQVTNSLDVENENDSGCSISDDPNKTSGVEVIKLSVPKPEKCDIPQHIPNSSQRVKSINKPPMPTPRQRKSGNTVSSPSPQSDVNVQFPWGNKLAFFKTGNADTGIEEETEIVRKISKLHIPTQSGKTVGAPSLQTDVNVQLLCARGNKLGLCETSHAETEIEEETERATEDKTNSKKIENDFPNGQGTPEKETVSAAYTDFKRVECSKAKASIFKKKRKGKTIKRSKLISRRKPLNITPSLFLQNRHGAIRKKLTKRNVLINRERMATPQIDMNSVVEESGDFKCKSLPTNLGKSLQIQDNNLKETTDTDENSDETYEAPLYYSEPFRCHRGKEDEDIFTTVEQVLPGSIAKTQLPKSIDLFQFQPSITATGVAQQRRMSETDELLDVLEACNIGSNEEDCALNSNAEIKTVTKETLKPELRKHLEKVRDLESKLNHLVHDGKVLERRLQLQEDVNEILKRNRQISSKLSVKEKEAKALEAAIDGDILEPLESTDVPNYQETICTKTNERSACITENMETSAGILRNKHVLDNSDKDSAFCSEFTTKL